MKARTWFLAPAASLLAVLVLDLSSTIQAQSQGGAPSALTALTALTLPATLISSWYGMNFHNMPELRSPLGYPLAFLATLLTTATMWWWCKRKRWI